MNDPIANAKVVLSWSHPWDEMLQRTLVETHRQEGIHWAESTPGLREPDESERISAPKAARYSFTPALGDDHDPRIAILTVWLAEQSDLRYRLIVSPPPAALPPAPVEAINHELGRRSRISALVGGPKALRTPVGAYHVVLSLLESRWRCPLIPSRLSPEETMACGDLGHATREQIGFRFESGVSGIEEVALIYLHEELRFSLSIRARATVALGTEGLRWLPSSDPIAALALSRFFEEKMA